jgi:hypothetical protein
MSHDTVTTHIYALGQRKSNTETKGMKPKAGPSHVASTGAGNAGEAPSAPGPAPASVPALNEDDEDEPTVSPVKKRNMRRAKKEARRIL